MAKPVITKPGDQANNGNVLSAVTPLTIVATGTPTKIDATGLPTGLSIAKTGAKIGEITGTPTKTEVATVKLSAENAEGAATVEPTFTWTIKEQFPVVTKPADQVSHVNIAITPVTLVATGGTATGFKVTSGLPKGLSLKEDTGVFSGTPDTVAGAAVVTVKARTSDGTNSAEVVFNWTIAIDEPVITKPADRITDAGTSVSLAIVASGSPTLYAATGLPEGLTINATTGVITGCPQQPTATANLVTVKAENAGGPSAEVSFEWKVNRSIAAENALSAKTPGASWVAPPLWPLRRG